MTDCTTYTPREIDLVHGRAIEEDAARNAPPDLAEEVADGLEKLAAMIRRSKATVKFSPYGLERITYNAGSAAEVDEIAAGLGVEPRWNQDRTHYKAVWHGSDRAAYQALYITLEAMARYAAAGSYAGCVEPAGAESPVTA